MDSTISNGSNNNWSVNSNGANTVWSSGAPTTSNSNVSGGGYLTGSGTLTGSVGQAVASGTIWGKTPATHPNMSIQYNAVPQSTPGVMNKSKLRYVIIKEDSTSLELKEQPTISPREMIGLTKFINLVATYSLAIKGDFSGAYNLNICWSELIKDLQIDKHFVPGSVSSYNTTSDTLDVILFDPPQ